jgi:uncharacterized protein YceK
MKANTPSKRCLATVLQITLAVVYVSSLTGCGTVMRGTMKESPEFSIYPATRCDVGFVAMGWIPLVLDLPISLATDTVLLPYDIATLPKNKHTETAITLNTPIQ